VSETDLQIQLRCQRCGDPMELRDPAPGAAWAPVQYWVCNRCGRHFWTTYASPAGKAAEDEKPAAAKAAAPAAAKPAAAAAPKPAASPAAPKPAGPSASPEPTAPATPTTAPVPTGSAPTS